MLARAAVALAIAGLFMETYPDPERALSNGPNSWPLSEMEGLLDTLKAIDGAAKARRIFVMSLSSNDQRAVFTDTPINVDDGDTVFGKRWGSEIIRVTPEQIEALRQGRYIALDVQGEYVVYLQLADDEGDTSCPD